MSEEKNKTGGNQMPALTQSALAPTALPVDALPVGWSYNSHKSLENVRKARALMNTRHGMYSGVPIICQGTDCPFRDTCWIPTNELEVGSRCPIEVGAIIERYDKYVTELNIGDSDTVDHGLIKDVIDCEILILRADNALAISGAFIEDVVAGVDAKGNDIMRPELHKAFEAKSRLRQERIKLLNQLNSTRKDKRMEAGGLTDPSSIAMQLMQKMKRLQEEGKIIDATVVEATEVNEDGKDGTSS